jgi:aminopeptidase N
MQTPSATVRLALVALLAVLVAAPTARAADKLLHLAIGDPARKDREAPLALDAITDTKTGDLITPAELASRLASTRLLLIGEEHTSVECHRVQLRVLEALVKAGRHVLIGLEMYPYTEQRGLDQWRDGLLTEDGFVRLSRWYDNWGYNWLYYRDIFLFARDQRVPMFAVNAPREVVSAVGRKGLTGLTPEEAAQIPKEIDAENADHMTFFRTTFEGEQGAVHGPGGMGDDMLKNMLAAQATWDAAMGYNGVQALKQANDPKAIMVILVGSGHVAYGVGIERQARKWADGPITSIIPTSVGTAASGLTKTTQASYANFTWGIPEELDSAYPTLGTSTQVGKADQARTVINVQKGSPADKAGIKVRDVLVSIDGVSLADREAYNLLMARKQWGDTATIVVRRGTETLTLTAVFRRAVSEK